jgi:hypothetical protein
VTWDKPAVLGDGDVMSPRTFAAKEKADADALHKYTNHRKLVAQANAHAEVADKRHAIEEARGGMSEKAAATRIQATWRMYEARVLLLSMAEKLFKLEYDSATG